MKQPFRAAHISLETHSFVNVASGAECVVHDHKERSNHVDTSTVLTNLPASLMGVVRGDTALTSSVAEGSKTLLFRYAC